MTKPPQEKKFKKVATMQVILLSYHRLVKWGGKEELSLIPSSKKIKKTQNSFRKESTDGIGWNPSPINQAQGPIPGPVSRGMQFQKLTAK